MAVHYIIPETEPETELIDGRLVQKMSPKRRHQALEMRWAQALQAWSAGRGEALTEWRHVFTAPGHTFASLVPEVAYQPFTTLDALGAAASEAPPCAPYAVVEILSRGESEHDLRLKVGAYLAAGTRVVFVVDPPHRTVVAHAPSAQREGAASPARFGPGEIVTHPALPGFAYAIDAMFEGLYLGD